MRIVTLFTILCSVLCVPAFADLYNNGPTNGTNGAYFIDASQVSDSFTTIVCGECGILMTSFDVALWVPRGATPLTVDWAVGTSSFGGDLAHGGGSWSSLTLLCTSGQPFNGGVCGGGFGYDVYDANMATPNINLDMGNTYWLTLSNATDNFGGRDAWDINSGPSMAYHNSLGSVPSESFTVNGQIFFGVPEPSSILLFGSGCFGLIGLLRRKLM
jgi:hypothetical protein